MSAQDRDLEAGDARADEGAVASEEPAREPLKFCGFRAEPSLLGRVDALAAKQGITRSAFIRRAVEEKVSRRQVRAGEMTASEYREALKRLGALRVALAGLEARGEDVGEADEVAGWMVELLDRVYVTRGEG
jgi:predicted transcriptional regulator